MQQVFIINLEVAAKRSRSKAKSQQSGDPPFSGGIRPFSGGIMPSSGGIRPSFGGVNIGAKRKYLRGITNHEHRESNFSSL